MAKLVTIRRNRDKFSGCFLPGCSLISAEGFWVGPGLGNFRNVAAARKWAALAGYLVA